MSVGKLFLYYISIKTLPSLNTINLMLKIILTLICCLPTVSYGQEISLHVKKISSDRIIPCDTIYVESVKENKYIVRIYNPTKESVYLFSSYFNDDLFMSKYLHLYSEKNNSCILSFLPLPYFLSYTRSDNVILGANAVVNRNQIIYQFLEIPRASFIEILLPDTCFDADYVNCYDARKMSPNNRPTFKVAKGLRRCSKKEIQVAVYANIGTLNKEVYYADPYSFSQGISDYRLLSITIK